MRDLTAKLITKLALEGEVAARYQALFETTLDAIVTMDHEGKVVEFNPAAERIFGYTREQVLGEPLVELIIPPSLRAPHDRGLARLMTTGEGAVLGRRLELNAIRADGTEFPIELTITRIRTEGPPLFTGFMRDLTAQRQAAERLACEHRLTRILAEAADLVEAAPRILPALCQCLQSDVCELWEVDEAGTALKCTGWWCGAPSPERARFQEASRARTFRLGVVLPGRVWESRETVSIPDLSQDTNFPRLALATAAGLRSALAFPIVTEQEFFGVIEFFSDRLWEPDAALTRMMTAIGQDIAQFMRRRRAERALAAERERLQTERRQADENRQRLAAIVERLHLALAAGSMGIWTREMDGTDRVDWSPELEAIFGLAPGEFPGTHEAYTALIHVEDRQKVSDAVREAVETRTDYEVEFRFTPKGGGMRWMIGRGRASYDADGRPVRLAGVGIDVTARRQVELENARLYGEAREADRRKDEFLAMLAHELRNPLAPISNALQLMTLRGDDRAVVERAREIIQRQAQQLTRLVDDLLDVSRITRGKITLQPRPLDLAAVVASAVETTRPIVDARRHRITLSLPREPVDLEADPARLEQILTNLLNNAAKYMEEGGQISLTVAVEGAEVVFRVRDAGIGIAPEMLPRIFDLFAQAERSLDRAQGGLGIGLTLVHRLVEMHGGSVEAHSEGPGKGSEFVVRLPSRRERGAVSPTPAITPPSGVSTSSRVLVVDDNTDSADSMALLVAGWGHTVEVAYEGVGAVEVARRFQPDVVLLDIGLPGIDGYEVARRLRAMTALATTHLVAMTGYGQTEDRRRSQEAGFQQHLVKPVDVEILRSLLATHRSDASLT